MTSEPGPTKTAQQSDVRRPGSNRPGIPEWLGPIAVCLGLALVAVLRNWDQAERFHMPLRWMSVAALVATAWICRPRFAVTASLIALLTWSWIEIRDAPWWQWLPAHLVRFVVGMGLVIWLTRLREQLTAARRLARIDSLTGLPNRPALIEALDAEIARSRRFGRPFSVAVLDCDGFKQINDQQGHLVGDDVLRRIGESLRQETRPFDCAGRWGGDEFLLVLSEMDHDDAQLIAERLRAAMRHNVEREYPSLTLSLGVITVLDATMEWEDCVRRADEAMYAAKRLGRDQTRFEIVGSR